MTELVENCLCFIKQKTKFSSFQISKGSQSFQLHTNQAVSRIQQKLKTIQRPTDQVWSQHKIEQKHQFCKKPLLRPQWIRIDSHRKKKQHLKRVGFLPKLQHPRNIIATVDDYGFKFCTASLSYKYSLSQKLSQNFTNSKFTIIPTQIYFGVQSNLTNLSFRGYFAFQDNCQSAGIFRIKERLQRVKTNIEFCSRSQTRQLLAPLIPSVSLNDGSICFRSNFWVSKQQPIRSEINHFISKCYCKLVKLSPLVHSIVNGQYSSDSPQVLTHSEESKINRRFLENQCLTQIKPSANIHVLNISIQKFKAVEKKQATERLFRYSFSKKMQTYDSQNQNQKAAEIKLSQNSSIDKKNEEKELNALFLIKKREKLKDYNQSFFCQQNRNWIRYSEVFEGLKKKYHKIQRLYIAETEKQTEYFVKFNHTNQLSSWPSLSKRYNSNPNLERAEKTKYNHSCISSSIHENRKFTLSDSQLLSIKQDVCKEMGRELIFEMSLPLGTQNSIAGDVSGKKYLKCRLLSLESMQQHLTVHELLSGKQFLQSYSNQKRLCPLNRFLMASFNPQLYLRWIKKSVDSADLPMNQTKLKKDERRSSLSESVFFQEHDQSTIFLNQNNSEQKHISVPRKPEMKPQQNFKSVYSDADFEESSLYSQVQLEGVPCSHKTYLNSSEMLISVELAYNVVGLETFVEKSSSWLSYGKRISLFKQLVEFCYLLQCSGLDNLLVVDTQQIFVSRNLMIKVTPKLKSSVSKANLSSCLLRSFYVLMRGKRFESVPQLESQDRLIHSAGTEWFMKIASIKGVNLLWQILLNINCKSPQSTSSPNMSWLLLCLENLIEDYPY